MFFLLMHFGGYLRMIIKISTGFITVTVVSVFNLVQSQNAETLTQ